MYRRNYIYISSENQEIIKNCHILIGGCGLGSVIAECALRLGFENICIIDGDKVELSNLNRQNYTQQDIGKYKVDSLRNRLIKINPNASVCAVPEFLTECNISEHLLQNFDIAINTIDYTSEIPFLFDEICCEQHIPVLHPLNLGWGAGVFIIKSNNIRLREIHSNYKNFEIHLARHILKKLEEQNSVPDYLPKVLEEYHALKHKKISPPQLAVGSWIVASMCTTLIYKLFLGEKVKIFPDVYFKCI